MSSWADSYNLWAESRFLPTTYETADFFGKLGSGEPLVRTPVSQSGLSDMNSLLSQIYTFEENSADRYMNDSKTLLDYEYDYNRDLANSANEFTAQQNELNRQFQHDEASLLRDFNASESKAQRDWETEMSNSAYTRAVQDLKNAGLNPVLALRLGGASTPSGASASQGSVPSGSVGTASRGSVGSKSARKSDLASSLVQLITSQLASSAQEVSAVGSVLTGLGRLLY